ncbi:uncharacterized protein LOC125075589 [Vanessa atalanta]|uniref:uncharacterized protein LOC125075589 n=1 Tax=Vanessa atalanta TaxID=42275 RepID=UPI001FCD0175|nr:uncharacterized protein LOC125075589 [Vanessa atalanta]
MDIVLWGASAKWFEDEYLMPIPIFDELLSLLSIHLSKQDTNMRKSIGACERLAVTLQYLASETSYKRLQNKYRISKKTLVKLIKETCGIVWKVQAPKEMAAPNKESWKRIAERFKDNANFPHCLGALDGKHIRIQCPRNSGSLYFNYKKYNSIVLLALVDSNCLFTVIDVGSYGRENDSTIFQSSILGQKLNKEALDLPEEEELVFDGPKMPYVIVVDEAFARPLRARRESAAGPLLVAAG